MSLRHAILSVLSRKPRTGYDITQALNGGIGFFWSATHQQIYKELALIESLDLVSFKTVEQEGKPNKKIYKISAKGIKALKEWIVAPTELPPAKDALLIKLFMGDLVDPEILINELTRHKKMREQKLKVYKEIEKTHFSKTKKLSQEEEFQYLTLRRGFLFEEAWITWAAEVLKKLEKR